MITGHAPLTLWAVPFFIVTIVLERWYLADRGRKRRLRGYENRDTWASLAMGLGSLIVGLLIILGDVVISLWAWEHRIADLGSGVMAWTVALVGWDFAYYWNHRAGHRIRILWANHVQHHSSERYNLSTALRQPVTSFNELLFFPTLAFFGIQPWIIFASGGINLIYQYWIHTEAIDRMPRWFEFVFNTPSHHRVHHGSNQQYLDRNYGGILIIWDRLFGTFEPETEMVTYGLTKNIHTFNPLRIAFHEYAAVWRALRTTRGLAPKLGRLFMPPGWDPSYTPRH